MILYPDSPCEVCVCSGVGYVVSGERSAEFQWCPVAFVMEMVLNWLHQILYCPEWTLVYLGVYLNVLV